MLKILATQYAKLFSNTYIHFEDPGMIRITILSIINIFLKTIAFRKFRKFSQNFLLYSASFVTTPVPMHPSSKAYCNCKIIFEKSRIHRLLCQSLLLSTIAYVYTYV